MSKDISKKGKSTQAIHAGQDPDPVTGAVSVPIYQCSTFAFPSAEEGRRRFAGQSDGFIYTRLGNPTIEAFEESIATLEEGYGACATATGMAAVTTSLFAVVSAGDHIVGTDAVYGPSRIVVEREFSRFGVESSFVDTSDFSQIEKACKKNTKVLFIETPANPTIKLTDIAKCARFARERNILLFVDNTFSTPILQRPLSLGADVVIHSVTKFINGHSDVVGGIIVASTEELHKRIDKVNKMLGGTMDPHQAWLVLRGVKTLTLRVKDSEAKAIKLAELLEGHPKVKWVRYPGLKSHPQHELAKKQMFGFGALMAFELEGGLEAGKKMIDNVRLAILAVSLGGIESLIQHPASMTHAGMTAEEKERAGITDGLIRLSVGCEDYEDLKEDLEQALEFA